MIRRRITLAILAATLCAGTLRAAEEKVDSRYTSTAREKCSSFKTNADDASGFESVCTGLGGYQLLHLGGDDRSWIDLRYNGKSTDLYGPTMEAAPGGFPHKANDVVEWRGVVRGDHFTPYALIYRIAGTNEETQRTKTRLLVIKLDAERSAIIGRAEGAEEDAKAKRIADTARPQ